MHQNDCPRCRSAGCLSEIGKYHCKQPVAEKDVDAIVAYLTAMPHQKAAPATGKAQDPDPKVAPDVSGGTG